MPLFEIVALLEEANYLGTGKIRESIVTKDSQVFAGHREDAIAVFREINGEELTKAREKGTVSVLCRPFCPDC